MVITMAADAGQEQVERVCRHLEQHGLRPSFLRRDGWLAIGAVGSDITEVCRRSVEQLPGVERVIPISEPYKLVSRAVQPQGSVMQIGEDLSIGGRQFVMMAGPCAVESEVQLLRVAHAVKEAGARVLRGGAFKPRTSPYSFQGLGEQGLQLLSKAKCETGLKVVTEVMAPEHLDEVCEVADILQVGARNMQNYFLLSRLGSARRPVLLKRGLSSTLQELLLAAEYIVSEGNPDVILCERGIRTFETYTRNTLDLGGVARLRELTHLPIVVDPSHAAGRRSLVPPLARAAVAVGADGLLVEVHPNPEQALSDGAQSLTLNQFTDLMQSLGPYLSAQVRSLEPRASQRRYPGRRRREN